MQLFATDIYVVNFIKLLVCMYNYYEMALTFAICSVLLVICYN